MPTHIETIQLTRAQLRRGARLEDYARRLREWREGTTTDAEWERMKATDPQFRTWLWKQGA